jgi:hypothetical protein
VRDRRIGRERFAALGLAVRGPQPEGERSEGETVAGKFVTLVLSGLQDEEVSPGAKLVCAAIADCANIAHGGVAWPSVARLARMASISERQAREHITTLSRRDWIACESGRGGGRGQTTRYRLHVERLTAVARQQKAEDEFRVSERERARKAGSVVPGIAPSESLSTKAEVSDANPEVSNTKGGTIPHKTRNQGSAEQVLNLNIKGSEPESARARTREIATRLKEALTAEPEKSAGNGQRHMTREEQVAASRDPIVAARLRREHEERLQEEQARENTRRMLERQKAAGKG